jgi:hypothetical protein
MITYERNMPFAKETKKELNKQWNVPMKHIKIIKGYKIGDPPNYPKHSTVLFYGVKDKLLPKMIQGNEDAYYIEDDVRFTQDPYMTKKRDITWSIYRNGKLTNKKKIITGSQAIYFSKKTQKELKNHMEQSNPAHIDSYFSRFSHDMIKKGYNFYQHETKMGYEKDHKSLISKDKDWNKYKKPN